MKKQKMKQITILVAASIAVTALCIPCSMDYVANAPLKFDIVLPMLLGMAVVSRAVNSIEFGTKRNNSNNEIEEACGILKEIVDRLHYPRRIKMLKSLEFPKTFSQLKRETGISTGSLHNHLRELWKAGFIYKTDERPAKYGRTVFLEYLVSLAERAETEMGKNELNKIWQNQQLVSNFGEATNEREMLSATEEAGYG